VRESRLQLALLVLAALFYPITERWVAPWQITVDWPFLLLFWIAFRRGRVAGCFYGLLLGLLRDLADFSQLGATALGFTIGGWLLGTLREKVDRESLGVRLLLLAVVYLIVQAVFLFVRAGWSPGAAVLAWLRYALPGSVLTAAGYLASLLIAAFLREGLGLLREPLDRR